VDLRQLRYFVEIVDLKSMSKAAARLHVAQPALSQNVAALESELRTQLLVRSTKGVQPTAAGTSFYRHARLILRQLDEARRDVQTASDDVSGVVTLGLPTSTTAILGLPLIQVLRQRYPDIHLQLFESVSGYLEEFLNSGRLDLAVLPHAAGMHDIAVEPILEEELFFIGRMNGCLDEFQTIPLSVLARVPLVLPSRSQELRHLIEQTVQRHHLELNVIADVDSLPLLLATARDGLAGTILPFSALALEPQPISLQYRSLAPRLARPISVCRLRSAPITAAAAAVYNALLQLAADAVASKHWVGAELVSQNHSSIFAER